MTLREIVEAYLSGNGFDGLFNAREECACQRGDMFPCSGPHEDCAAGYKAPCPPECGEGHEFHIVAVKPETGRCG